MARLVDDESAFEALYRRYVRRISAFAASRGGSPEDVADIVAQTFVRLLRQSDRYDAERGTVASFVFALAASEVADHRRRTSRDRDLVERVRSRAPLTADDVSRLDDAIDAHRLAASLAPVLDELSPSEAEVLRLVASGLSTAEAARSLDITPNAARVRLARARRRVRDRLVPTPGAHAAPRPDVADPA